MFKHYFEQIHNVDVWPIISLSIFFVFFILLIVWVLTAKKNEMDVRSRMPLDSDNGNNSTLNDQAL